MYLEALVKVPDVKGKITFRTKGGATYVEYECNRVYFPDRKYTTVSRKTIGKHCRREKADHQEPDVQLP